jgi:hypothetical protein
MKMYNLIIKASIMACIICSTGSFASNYVECYDCSSEEMKSIALTWAKNNISDSEARNNVRKDVHLINILDNDVESYQVHFNLFKYQPLYPVHTFLLVRELILP